MIAKHVRLGVRSQTYLAKSPTGTHQSVRRPSSISSHIDTVRQDLEQWLDVRHVRPEKRHSDAMEESVDLSDTSKGRPGRWKLCVQMLNNTEYELAPEWFFTSPQIDTFLAGALPAWNTNLIARELEAFGIAGCDMYRELLTTRRRCVNVSPAVLC